MFKKLFLLFIALTSIVFISCSEDIDKDKQKVSATAKIRVIENGKAKSGVTVCMFIPEKGPGSGFYEPLFADRKVITESGVAIFELRKTFDLNVIDTQTTFYFAVFNRNGDRVLGETAMTIKKGETKTATIYLR